MSFSVGQIHGYFKGEEPDDGFWILYSLYLAMSIFSSVTWTKHVCPDEMPDMIRILCFGFFDNQSAFFNSRLCDYLIQFDYDDVGSLLESV